MGTLSFEPTGGPLGAFVHGLHFDNIDGRALRDALNEYRLLCIRGQVIADDGHTALASSLGHLATEGAGFITLVSNVAPGGALGGDGASWHSDYMFYPSPYEYISLYALELPASGTQTRFVDAVAAARALPAALRASVADLEGRAVADLSPRSPGQAGIVYLDGRRDGVDPHFLRPVLWPHPATGEEVLAVWHQQTDAILPLPQEASAALLHELFAHLYQPAFQYVHQWEAHDLVIWDNRALQHSRPHVGTTDPRTLRRISVGEDQDLSIFYTMESAGGPALPQQAQPPNHLSGASGTSLHRNRESRKIVSRSTKWRSAGEASQDVRCDCGGHIRGRHGPGRAAVHSIT